MKLFKPISLLCIILAGASIAPPAMAHAPASATEPNWVALVGPHPQLGSKASQDNSP